jgi:hypothetical protein
MLWPLLARLPPQPFDLTKARPQRAMRKGTEIVETNYRRPATALAPSNRRGVTSGRRLG